MIVEKPVIVQRFVERPVETVVETSETTRVVTHEATGKATDVKAKFIERGIRETEWVERETGEHPDDSIAGDETPEYRRSRWSASWKVHEGSRAAARASGRPETPEPVI